MHHFCFLKEEFFIKCHQFNTTLFVFIRRNDTDAELEVVKAAAIENGAFDAIVTYHFAEGGKGAEKLADALSRACANRTSTFRFLYELNKSIEEKVLTVAQEMYGAGEVEFQPIVKEKIQLYNAQVNDERLLL